MGDQEFLLFLRGTGFFSFPPSGGAWKFFNSLFCDMSKIFCSPLTYIGNVQRVLKELKRIADKIVTLAKKGNLHSRRLLMARVKQEDAVRKLIDVLAPRYSERSGGYSRVLKAGFRHGDMAPMAIIEFVDRDISAKGASDRARAEEETPTEE